MPPLVSEDSEVLKGVQCSTTTEVLVVHVHLEAQKTVCLHSTVDRVLPRAKLHEENLFAGPEALITIFVIMVNSQTVPWTAPVFSSGAPAWKAQPCAAKAAFATFGVQSDPNLVTLDGHSTLQKDF